MQAQQLDEQFDLFVAGWPHLVVCFHGSSLVVGIKKPGAVNAGSDGGTAALFGYVGHEKTPEAFSLGVPWCHCF